MIQPKIKLKKKKLSSKTSQALRQLKVLSKRNNTQLKLASLGLSRLKEQLKIGNDGLDLWNADFPSSELGFLFEESYLLRSKMEEKKRKKRKILHLRLWGLTLAKGRNNKKEKLWRDYTKVSRKNSGKKRKTGYKIKKVGGTPLVFCENHSFFQLVQNRSELKFLRKERKKKKLFLLKSLQLRQNQGRHFYHLLVDRRLLARTLNQEKKIKYTRLSLRKSSKKLPRLLFSRSYKRRLKYYYSRRILKRRRYKKLRWRFRRNRKKKWRRRGLFRLFRSRYCFRSRFYVPRHFEVNYKTGNLFFLGFTHSDSTDFRISSIFNIRKLVTFLSS